MVDVIIIGAGGHAAEVNDYIICSKGRNGNPDINVIGFIDDDPDSYKSYNYDAPYLGSLGNHDVSLKYFYIMAIANIKYRRPIIDDFLKKGARFISLFHQSAYISKSARIGTGTILGPNVNIGPNVHVGCYNLINSRASLGHDTKMGSFNFISPNVSFSGNTCIGDENLFGINSATLPGVSLGHRNKISAGMIVDQNVNDDSVVFYRFKEKIIAVPKK